jgi:rRNA maturation endonuclease Nob1
LADGAAKAARTRRPPLGALALAGALLAAGYGHFVLAMRFGPPLVMVGLGGLTLALCAAALWRVIDPLTRGEVAVVPEARAPHRIRELEREKQAVLKAIKEIELDYQMRKISEVDYREMVERYRARALRIMGDLAVGDDYRALIERELKDRLSARAAAAGLNAPDRARDRVPDVAPDRARDGAPDGASDVGGSASPAPVQMKAVTPSNSEGASVINTNCATCGAVNDLDAQFCKKCGQKLTPSAGPV